MLRRLQLPALGIALVLWALPAAVHAQVTMRLSVKLLYDDSVSPPIPPGGDRDGNGIEDPDHCGNYNASAFSCDSEVIEKVDYLNQVLARMGRGIRFNLVEIVHLTDPPDPPPEVGATEWTNAPDLGAVQNPLNAAAMADPETWAWRDDAINYYIFNTVAGGYSDNILWNTGNNAITTGQNTRGSWTRIMHEIGHYLGLYHTFGHNGISCDDVCDTIVDQESGTLDGVAVGYFGASFLSLPCEQQQQVLDVWFNIMSYHADDDHTSVCLDFDPGTVACGAGSYPTGCRHRLTQDQLDRITARLNALETIGVVTGRTVFVDETTRTPCNFSGCADPANCPCEPDDDECPCTQAPRNTSGAPVAPMATVAQGLAVTGTDARRDVLLIRGGSYDESMIIDQAVTLRGSRGAVVIGRN